MLTLPIFQNLIICPWLSLPFFQYLTKDLLCSILNVFPKFENFPMVYPLVFSNIDTKSTLFDFEVHGKV